MAHHGQICACCPVRCQLNARCIIDQRLCMHMLPSEIVFRICRQVMKYSKGLVNPRLLNEALNKRLKDALAAKA